MTANKPSTVAARLSAIRRFFDACKWAGLCGENPAEGIRPPRDKRSDDSGLFLSETDLGVLFHGNAGRGATWEA